MDRITNAVTMETKVVQSRSSSWRGALWSYWCSYVLMLRSLLARCEIFFELIGRKIARNPKKTLFVAMVAVGLSTLGFLRFHTEIRTTKLFLPENTISEQALLTGSSYFPNTFNTRTEEIIIIPKNGTNIFGMERLQEIMMVVKTVENITGYRNVCRTQREFMKSLSMRSRISNNCAQMNPISILNGKEKSIFIVYKKLKSALSMTSTTMSNGRAPIFNIKEGLTKFTLDDNKKVPFARALKIQVFLKQWKSSSEKHNILQWEKTFVEKMTAMRDNLRSVHLFFSAERSLDDSLIESSSRDISLISITFTVMIMFSCFMLAKFINPVRGHTWLAMAGVLSTGLGILAGFGISLGLGVPFINLVGVVPFLVVSIGIDDMFIIVDEFDRQPKSSTPEKRVSYALSKVGATITMTTVTDVIAFFVGSTSSFPAIRYFCIYTAICINIEFMLQISLFVAFLAFDSRRIFANKSDCCPMLEVQDRTCFRLPNDFSFAAKIMRKYGHCLLTCKGKTTVCVLLLGLISFGLYGCMNVSNEFDRKSLALKGTYYYDYIRVSESEFPQTIPVSIQITKSVNYSDPLVRQQISKLPKIAHDTGFYLRQNFTWVHYLNDFANRLKIPIDKTNFKNMIKLFLSLPVYRQHNVDIFLDKSGNIIASRVIVFLKDNSKSTFQKDAMIKLRESLKKHSPLECTVAADPFLYFEQYAIVLKEVLTNLFLVSTVIVVILIPFCIQPVIIMCIDFGFLLLILEIFGLMYFWNVQLNAISMINILMSVGFSVDYSAHIAHSFATSTSAKVDERIIDALSTVGGSVLLGGLSTFLGMSLTGFAASTIFQTFFKMFLGIIVFGLFNGLAVLPVLLSILSRFLVSEAKMSQEELPKPFQLKWFSNKLNNSQQCKRKRKRKFSVSITGMSTRFPTARGNKQFKRLLEEGRNTAMSYPDNRYARGKYFDCFFNPTRPVAGRLYVSDGSYLENIEKFDHQFFGISASEARSMDPQQRMLLQGVYDAIEDAGLTVEELQQCITGVYVGIMNLDYSSVVLQDESMLSIDQFASTGTAFSIAANRISFSLNLTGPSIAIDTACSSSMTALSIACDHLKKRSVDVAIVAAANLVLCTRKQVTICRTNMLAPDGKCKVFDERADGYGRGEGIVAFVLKANDLLNVKEDPYCDIIGWGINNDGQTAAPITAPSVESQRELMVNVLQHACVDPQDVQYVEMHGTGTIIGDIVETKSVGEVYGKSRKQSDPVRIGSAKSNINHTESAAGLAGLAKVCLMMECNKIFPTVGIENQAIRLDIESKGLIVPVELCDWPEINDKPKLAAVNSFGYGGSNGHLLVQKSTKTKISTNKKKKKYNMEHGSMRLFVLSARSQAALTEMAKSFKSWFKSMEDNEENIASVCYTLTERRSNHKVRLSVAATSLTDASKNLQKFSENPEEKMVGVFAGKTIKSCSSIALIFGGQGSQWLGMAGDVLFDPFMFRIIKKIDKRARKRGYRHSLISYLNGTEGIEDDLVSVQLSIFALQYAVALFLQRKASIIPAAVGGHSLGDITAACVADIITTKEAISIILARASLQDQCKSEGAMAAIGMQSKDVVAMFKELSVENQVCIAAENDKASVTISGDKDAVNKIEHYVQSAKTGIFWRKLDTHKAFHSHHMEEIEQKFKNKIREGKVKPRNSQTLFVSSTLGKIVKGSEIKEEYWWMNLRNPVLFNNCVKKMLSEGISVFIEISPRPVLSHYIKEIGKQVQAQETSIIQALPRKKENNRMQHLFAQCIGQMYTLGYQISFDLLQDQDEGNFLRCPLYPWQEVQLWVKDQFCPPARTMQLLGIPDEITSEKSSWNSEIDLHSYKNLADHKMKSAGCILPGACYIEMALEASLSDTKIAPTVVKDIIFQNILPLNEHLVRKLKSIRTKSNSEMGDYFSITHVTEKGDMPLAKAKIIPIFSQQEPCLSLAEGISEGMQMLKKLHEDDLDSSIMSNKRSSQGNSSEIAADSGVYEISDKNRIHDEQSLASSSTELETVNKDQADGDQLKHPVFPEEDVILSKLNFGNDYKVIDAKEFKELTLKTGFEFGENFSLIEFAFSGERKALVKLHLFDDVLAGMRDFVVHPCIIDACLQACLAIASNDPNRNVIPIGVQAARLNPIQRKFSALYGYAEIDETAPDSCNVKLLDDGGEAILIMQGFQVKEMSRSQRRPEIEKCLYEMNWQQSDPNANGEHLKDYEEYIILGFKDCSIVNRTIECLSEFGIPDERVEFIEIQGADMISNFSKEFEERIENLSKDDSKIVVLNILPCFAQAFLLGQEFASSAQWLCFESTLSILKMLHNFKLKSSKILVFTCQSFGQISMEVQQDLIPWGSTSLGLARVTNLETNIPVIPIDLQLNSSKDEILVALKSIGLRSIEEGIIVSSSMTHQPMLQRVDPVKVMATERFPHEQLKNLYLSWSVSKQGYVIKRNVLGNVNATVDSVLIDVKYVSSLAGSSLQLLQNVKIADSKNLLQCAMGTVVECSSLESGFKTNDEVLAIFSSKWVKNRIRLPLDQVCRRPMTLSPRDSSIFPGHFALAKDIVLRIFNFGETIKSIFVSATVSTKGLCWAIATVASGKGADVTFEEILFSAKRENTMSQISDEYMKGSLSLTKMFDCVVCASDLHPVDRAALINATRKDGMMVVLDTDFKSATTQYSISRSIAVLNLKLCDLTSPTQLFSESVLEFEEGRYTPLAESTSISLSSICNSSEVENLFKTAFIFDCIKLNQDNGESFPIHSASMDIQGLKEDRTYIVIGGAKGLGLNTVSWMASRGAGTVLPVGRSEPTEETVSRYQELEKKYGTKIRFVQADVSTRKGINILKGELVNSPEVAGVVNSAAVIDDKLFNDIDRDSYQKVMQPKITGTINLHEMLENLKEDVDFFVLYSSITGVLGNTGQASYAAANAFMSSFADFRMKVLGRPCLAVSWGAMGGDGILERNQKVAMLLEKSGLHLLDIPTGLKWMDKVLTTMPQKSNICICDVDWRTFLNSLPSRKAESRIFDEIRKELPEAEQTSVNILEMILQEKSPEKQLQIIVNFIKTWIASWISGSAEEVDCNVPLFTYGIDSVGATAIKGQIEKDLQIDFQVFYFMQPETTISKLAEDLLKAIHDKFLKKSDDCSDEEEEELEETDEKQALISKEDDDDDDQLVLPKEYLSPIYKPDDAQANLFVIHPSHRYSGVFQAVGIGMKYQKMISLYAFGWNDPSVVGEDIGSVKRLAKACITLMSEVQPDGPYFLGGYSFGGLVALEMASILQNEGKDVSLLVMIDTIRWVPSGRNNTKLLINMADETIETEKHIKVMMNGFFTKIATRNLRMSLEQFDRESKGKTFDELKDFLKMKAEDMGIEIPDIDKILESTSKDQAMASKCHDEWIPGNLYEGEILYLQAEDEQFSQKIVGVGNSVKCWESVLHKKPISVTCPGDHYSMMDANRGPGIGMALSVATMVKYRSLFPNRVRLIQNGCQKQSLVDFKKNGINAIYIKKKVLIQSAIPGKLTVSKSHQKLKFTSENGKPFKERIHFKDVINISKLENHALLKSKRRIRNIDEHEVSAGICLTMKNHSTFRFMCLNSQDYRRLVYLLEAVFSAKLPF